MAVEIYHQGKALSSENFRACLESLEKEGFSGIELEVGAGVGWRALEHHLKLRRPKISIAIERTQKFEKLLGRVRAHERLGISTRGLLAIHADARAILPLLPNPPERLLFLYPNPEPKSPAARFFQHRSSQIWIHALKEEGLIELWTNLRHYHEASLQFMEKEFPEMCRIHVAHFQKNTPLRHAQFSPRTHFEKKYWNRGEILYQCLWRKIRSEKSRRPTVDESLFLATRWDAQRSPAN